MKGRLIAIDGVDGCGKSSQVDLVIKKLRDNYPQLKILATREPWDVEHNEIGKRIRKIVSMQGDKRVWADQTVLDHESLQYLFFLDRCVHYMKVIMPALEDGYLVITDRERMVTYSYGMAAGVKKEIIQGWHADIYNPDLYFYLKVSPDAAISRISSRNNGIDNPEEIFESSEALVKNIKGFDSVRKAGVVKNLVTINGNENKEVIAESIISAIEDKFSGWLSEFTTDQMTIFK